MCVHIIMTDEQDENNMSLPGEDIIQVIYIVATLQLLYFITWQLITSKFKTFPVLFVDICYIFNCLYCTKIKQVM